MYTSGSRQTKGNKKKNEACNGSKKTCGQRQQPGLPPRSLAMTPTIECGNRSELCRVSSLYLRQWQNEWYFYSKFRHDLFLF